ncbi:MAG: putative toxin-antitoxin system toxin component, PIN family [Thiohalorhabdaceae bacterium]
MRPFVVVDTNVLVGGLLTTDDTSPVAGVIDGVLAGRFPFLLSPQLVAEYREVLLRPKLRSLHRLTEEEVETILVEVAANGIWHEPIRAAPSAPDPGDDHLWDLLRSSQGAILVTGDRLLLEKPPEFASVLSPQSFLDLLAQK